MDSINHFYAYFDLVLGAVMMLIGFKVYRPFRKENEERVYKKYGNLYRFGGIGIFFWGLINLFNQYN